MKLNIRKIFLPVTICLFALVQGTFACAPREGDTWFTTTWEFDLSTLPPSVEIGIGDPRYEPYVIRNIGDTPFYLVNSSVSDSSKDYSGGELPTGVDPYYKLLNGNVYYFGRGFDANAQKTWRLGSGGINNSAAYQVPITYKMMENNGFKSANVEKDDRPSDVIVPSPEEFKIKYFYKGSFGYITGKEIYSINNNYNPEARFASKEECNKVEKGLEFILPEWVYFFLGMVIFITDLVYLFINRKSIKTINGIFIFIPIAFFLGLLWTIFGYILAK